MWLVTPMILLPSLDQAAASVEMFMLLPLLAMVAVYCYSRWHGHKDKHWLAAGFLAATALSYKYTALPILAFVFAAWLFEMRRSGAKANSIFRALGCAAAGAILASVLGLAFFLIHDGGRAFWECTVVFNRYYAASNLFGLGLFWFRFKDFWDNWLILFLVPLAVLLQPQRRIWFWLGIFLCSLVATNGGYYGQYYINIMPFLGDVKCRGDSRPGLAHFTMDTPPLSVDSRFDYRRCPVACHSPGCAVDASYQTAICRRKNGRIALY